MKKTEEITFEELKSFKYMFKQSPTIATIVVLLNVLIIAALGYLAF